MSDNEKPPISFPTKAIYVSEVERLPVDEAGELKRVLFDGAFGVTYRPPPLRLIQGGKSRPKK